MDIQNTTFIDTNGNEITTDSIGAFLGEVRMFAVSMTGAVTKSNLQGRGWAICDGTTPATQGISSPTITTTPDLQNKFIRMSDDESSGTTGGSDTASHQHLSPKHGTSKLYSSPFGTGTSSSDGYSLASSGGSGSDNTYDKTSSTTINTVPPYYEVAYFIKVR